MHAAMEDLVAAAIHPAMASILGPAIAELSLLPGAYPDYYGKEKHQILRFLHPAPWPAAPYLNHLVSHLNCLVSQSAPAAFSILPPLDRRLALRQLRLHHDCVKRHL